MLQIQLLKLEENKLETQKYVLSYYATCLDR